MRTTSGVPKYVDLAAAPKPRPRRELLMRLVQPAANALVWALARGGVHPQLLVLLHAAFGAAAAVLVAAGGPSAWLTAALLLQLKTVLDNADGGLARATGRVTRVGRYLDSVLDTLVSALLLAALAVHGPQPWGVPLAAVAFLGLMGVLSLDHNLGLRYRALRGQLPEEDDPLVGAPPSLYRLVKGAYDLLLAPQDRLVERLDDALFRLAQLRAGGPVELEHRLAWSDLFSTGTLVNLGLSTQMLALGVCLALGAPFAYVLLVLAQLGYVVVIQGVRVVRYLRYRRA